VQGSGRRYGDSERAREAFRALDFFMATELFHDTDCGTLRYVLPATTFLQMGNLAARFEHRPQGKLHLQYRAGWFPLWPSGVRSLDDLRVS
jgi:hypothetical protein